MLLSTDDENTITAAAYESAMHRWMDEMYTDNGRGASTTGIHVTDCRHWKALRVK